VVCFSVQNILPHSGTLLKLFLYISLRVAKRRIVLLRALSSFSALRTLASNSSPWRWSSSFCWAAYIMNTNNTLVNVSKRYYGFYRDIMASTGILWLMSNTGSMFQMDQTSLPFFLYNVFTVHQSTSTWQQRPVTKLQKPTETT